MNIIVATDKFKGSLTSVQAGGAIRRGILRENANATITCFPMADGGDGFASVMKYYLHTQTVQCETVDPLGRDIDASYEWNDSTSTAYVEVASASGLVLLKESERNPILTSSFGTGEMVKHAIARGAECIVLGLGGSATNDGGLGILMALGFGFFDSEGQLLSPEGGSLARVDSLVIPKTMPKIRFEIASDVTNVLLGENGAARVYAHQKGANAAMIESLEHGMAHFAALVNRITGREISSSPGTGAAGGIAAGLMAFFPLKFNSGIDMVMSASGIIDAVRSADLLVTGEGKIDSQSGEGKVVGRLAALASQSRISCVAVCGMLDATKDEWRSLGLEDVIAIVRDSTTIENALRNAGSLLEESAYELMRRMKTK